MELSRKASTLSSVALLATAVLSPGCELSPAAAVVARAQLLSSHPLGLFALAELSLVSLLAIGLLAGVLVRTILAWSGAERAAVPFGEP